MKRLTSLRFEREAIHTSDSLPTNPDDRGLLDRLIIIALGFGLATGMVEGVGLLLFQQINWARWGPMIHVSPEIIWISPLADSALWMAIAFLLFALAKLVRRLDAVKWLLVFSTFLCINDWLTLTGRLHRYACVLLALGASFAVYRWLEQNRPRSFLVFRSTLTRLVLLYLIVFAAIEGGKPLGEHQVDASLPAPALNSPNVLVVVIDTLRADHVSAYGYERNTTAELDKLASEGTWFSNAISASSWSLPSHVSLLTGRYLYDHGVGNVQRPPLFGWRAWAMGGFSTVGEELQHHGYRTGAFSANRTYFSSDLGFGRGFAHFEDYFHSPADMFVRTLYGREFARIFLKRSDKSFVKRMLRGAGFTSLLDQDAEGSGTYGGAFGIRKRADVVNRELLRWIDSAPAEEGKRRPFFAVLNYFDVHTPYGGPPPRPSPGTSTKDLYDDGVKYADRQLADLMEELGKRGIAKNTLLIVTSDHGEALGQHHLETHGDVLYWELIHVPLIIRYPGHVPAGLRVDPPVTNSAIPATILDLLNFDNPIFPRPSLADYWRHTRPPSGWPNPLSEIAKNEYPDQREKSASSFMPSAVDGPMRSIIAPRWQLISQHHGGVQLYDWISDPGETVDMSASIEGRNVVRELTSQMGARSVSARRSGDSE